MGKVIVVGSLNMDLTISAPYVPKAGETLTGSDFLTNCGGKGANQAAAAGKLGADTYMCGCVGDDVFGRQLVENLKNIGVNCDFIRTAEKSPSGIAVIVLTNGENRIILDKGANERLNEEDIDRILEASQAGDIYLTQLENPIEVIGYGIRKAKEKGLYVVLNPAPANADIMPYLESVDLITPNETELDILGGKKALFEKGVGTIITTLGSKGYEIDTGISSRVYECIKVKAVDTTAAGDTLCGGMCAMLSKGYNLEESAAFGSRAASIACTRIGASQSIPSEDEVVNYRTV